MKHNPARQKALADAAAGVIGSLVSVLVFYPVDVWKTNLQAGKHPQHNNDANENDGAVLIDTNGTVKLNNTTISHLLLRVSRRFRGLSYKITHTTVSSFAYFFVYSLVQSQYLAYRRSALLQHHSNINNNNNKSIRIPVFTKLVLAAFSAVINTSITLPLDTLASRMQAGTHELMHDTAGPVDISADGQEEYNNHTLDSKSKSQLYINSTEQFQFSFSTNLRDEFTTINPTKITRKNTNAHFVQRIQSITSLWNGIFPAILLCTNPAIQYTMYDSLKSWFLGQNTQQQHAVTITSSANNTQLSMSQSFLFGLLSKFVATVMTYPLIRAKVIMMVDTNSRNITAQQDDKHNAINKNNVAHNEGEKAPSNLERSSTPNSLLSLLMYIYNKNGIGGLYQGLYLQLLHTALKSALLLMVREKITVATRRFFQVE